MHKTKYQQPLLQVLQLADEHHLLAGSSEPKGFSATTMSDPGIGDSDDE